MRAFVTNGEISMCCYCMVGDHFFRFDPPWRDPDQPMRSPGPYVPAPITPIPTPPWTLERLIEVEDMLRRIKALEDELGCPCEPNKADYLALFRERIEKLEAEAAKRKAGEAG